MNHSNKFLRQRKFLLILPAMAVPFITLAFWALGGGKGNSKQVTNKSGLNTELPGANIKDDATDKLGYYEKAGTDSEKLTAMMKADPYLKKQLYDTPPEVKVYQKLDQIHAALDKAATGQTPAKHATHFDYADHIEKPQQRTGDPEMSQINSMLEKILDIQHPERLKDTISTTEKLSLRVSLADTNDGFYGLGDDTSTTAAIEASVYETQTLVSGATVKLRLLSDICVAGRVVPKNNFIYGTASMNNERLNITVTGIRYMNLLLPVALSVYDMDGMEGIYIPGAISSEVAKQSSDNALQNIGINSLDPSIGAQAAGAGIQAAKSLISKKVKLVRVTVKAGYRVLLKQQ